jgi:Secretion system C-terminal sorting domain
MKFIRILILLIFVVCGTTAVSQVNPVPFNLSTGNYSMNFWDSTSAPGTFPINSRWHRCAINSAPLAQSTSIDYIGLYRPSNNAAIVEGLNNDGFAFTSKPSVNNLGAFVVGLNSTGKTNLSVSFKIHETSVGSHYNVRLQYRLSRSSSWVDVPGPIEFVGTGSIGTLQSLGPYNISTLTGGAVNNRANMQIRWKYYWVSGIAGPTKFKVDDINITSTPLPGNSIASDSLNIPATGVCVTPTIGSTFTFQFRYTPTLNFTSGSCVFTAQLSDAVGSFVSPTNIGTVTSTANVNGQLMSVTIPPGTPSGTGYRIRVISANPSATSASDNVYDLIIKLSPTNITGLTANCGTTTSTLNWALPTTSCYDEVMVTASLVPTTTSPTGNGSAYTANSIYGSGTPYDNGFVVYKGNGTSTVVTNLMDGFIYYFKIWVRYGSEWSSSVEISCTPDVLTKVVVSGYLNASAAENEWTELLITGDDVDLRGWALRDNNTAQGGWQPEIVFKNISLWNHLRRGTIIMIWHRTTGHTLDVNPQDGYIEVEANPGVSTTYFSGGDGSTTLNISGTGDIIEVLSPGLTHVHGLGHLTTVGPSWTAMAMPKLNHASSINDGESVYVCPASNINDYNGPATGNAFTAINNTIITFGLPNTCAAGVSTNETYWKSLRQPLFTTQTVTITTLTFGTPGSVTFSWNPCIDPYPADNKVGYLILRNTANNFTLDPSDGTTYSVGSIIGSAEVVGIINTSAMATFTDNTVMNGFLYYYRVYAFRYGTDDANGDSYNVARGRAFNETNFVSVNWPGTNPLPINLLAFTGKKVESKVVLNWTTSSEKDNDYFLIEKRNNQGKFVTLGEVKGSLSSSSILHYSMDDLFPYPGVNYYRLTQFDVDGDSSVPRIVAVNFSSNNSIQLLISPNPFNSLIDLSCNVNEDSPLELEIFDYLGRAVLTKELVLYRGNNYFQLDLNKLSLGCYFVKATSFDVSFFERIVKQ